MHTGQARFFTRPVVKGAHHGGKAIKLKHFTGQRWILWFLLLAMAHLTGHATISSPDEKPARPAESKTGQVMVERIAPERSGGHGYRLVYHVNVPIAVFWKFKTDFDNTFLLENKYIHDHHFISQNDNIAITETKYTYAPGFFFRWQTTMIPDSYRLNFNLLNPEQCKQTYHYGHIQLEPEDDGTRVTQIAYFDFWGATLWAYNPWSGGMQDFLSYTARWEQATILRLKDRYHE